ncbi:MAG: mandelate racemase/muconate lactonizing enzyme family protein, partial [Parvibaculales bacterium]
MKIASIRTHYLQCDISPPLGFSQSFYKHRNFLLVEIISDGGISGWGESYGMAPVTQKAISDFYAPLLIGEDPLSIDVLWHKMWQSSLDFARKGVMMAAMSGRDMALGDLKGKALGRSISNLMGGAARQIVPCYITGMYFQDIPEDKLLKTLTTEAQTHAAKGYQALKIKIGKNPAFDEKLIKAVRKALPKMTLMADSNHAYDLAEATRIGRVLEEHNYHWFEEPLSPEASHLYRQLHARLDIAIAGGECEQTRYGFRDMLEAGGTDILQPDLAFCGGISEALKIRSLASAHGKQVIPHIWGSHLNLAAAAHFLATSHSEPGRIEPQPLLLEYDNSQNPLHDIAYKKDMEISPEGATIPTAAGLGVEIDEGGIKKLTIEKTET